MIKFTARLLILLLLVCLIGGCIYLAVSAAGPSALGLPTEGDGQGWRGGRGHAQGSGLGRGREHAVNPVAGLAGILKNLGVIALITLAVVGLRRVWKRIFHPRPAPSGGAISGV